MPINWSILNPNIASETAVTGMNAFQAALQRGDQQREQAQVSQLRGLQMDSARSELQNRESGQKAANLAAQAFELHQRDPNAAMELIRQGHETNAPAFLEVWKGLQSQSQLAADREQKDAEANRKLAIEAAPMWLKTIPQLRQFQQANPNATPEDYRRIAQESLGPFFDERQLPGITDPSKWSAIEQRANTFAEFNPAVIADRRAKEAEENRRRDDERAAAREARLERALANRPTTAPTTPEADRDIARYNRIVALGDKASPGEIAWRKKYEKSAGSGEMGAREAAFFDRVVNGASLGIAALNNIAQLPTTANTGPLGVGSSPGPSIFQSGLDTLRNALSDEEVQNYNTYVAGLVNNLAIIESSGLAPNSGFVHQFDRIMFREGDSKTGLVALGKMAEARQIIIRGLEPKLRNPRIPQEQKELINDLIAEVKRIIPYSQEDLIRFRAAQRKNPRLTIAQWGQQIPTAERRATSATPLGTPAAPLNIGTNPFAPTASPAAPTPQQGPTVSNW